MKNFLSISKQNFIIILINAALISSIIAAFFTLSDFSDKQFQKSIKIKINKGSVNKINVHAISLGNQSVLIKQETLQEFRLSRTYIKDIFIIINPELKKYKVDISTEKNTFTITENNITTLADKIKKSKSFDKNSDVYKLKEEIKSNSSIFPVSRNIKNWTGDITFILNGLSHFLYFFLLLTFILYILVIAFFHNKAEKNQITSSLKLYTMISKKLFNIKQNKEYFLNFLLFSISTVFFLVTIQIKNNFLLLSLTTNLYFIYMVLINWLIYFITVSLLFLLFRNKIVTYIYTAFYIYLVGQDTAIYFFGNTVFEKSHLALIKPYSLLGFLSIPALTIVISLSLLIFTLNISLCKLLSKITTKKLIKLIAILTFLSFFYIPEIYTNIRLAFTFSAVKRYSINIQKEQLEYSTQNSLINFIDEVFFKKTKLKLNVTSNITPYKDTINNFSLPIGKRVYKDLGLENFNKIVLFTSESMSSDLMNGMNNKLDINNSSFYTSPEVMDKSFMNYRTTYQPTLQGLVVTFNSHPNYSLLKEGKTSNFQNSVVLKLKEKNYKTIFVRSASKFYANENIHFKHLGFDKIIAREDFEKTHSQYISGWGVADRIIYDKVISLLEENKNEKLFITILGTDTHPLDGRTDFFDLDYPKTLGDYNKYGISSKFLNAVDKHNHDLNRFINIVKEKGLFTDETLFIFTADHGCPLNNVVTNIPGYEKNSLAKIPLIFLTKQDLPKINKSVMSSQLDFAPTLLHLLNMDIPSGYWGESLFSEKKNDLYIGYNQGKYFINTKDNKYIIFDNAKSSNENKAFLDLANSLIVDK